MTAPITARRWGAPWVLGVFGLLLLAYAASAGTRGTPAGAAAPGETIPGGLRAQQAGALPEVVTGSQVATFIFTQQ